ncbi:RagB/SusD family nutrient uptake outer membrane protein [Chitinophaga qingshengii]|uniref:RagB/SusD family nutrient uptake outer membrane protein n=1 Tax=Chitinophaga qingshengii TaxID=1569794 RepID=A0ABR7TP79_9BACT|nr:RagB/SusD family nutrient uptake outer membrane protein [Chitinophaga qingshengii]MBC9932288.1 RagB/SusD family nutrient uptake outer membrane protein [Chitinophaga qingshengii]
MLYTIKHWTIVIACVLAGSLLGGCNKVLEVNSPHLVNETNNWKSIQDTRSALLGTYGLMRAALADNNGYWLYGELRNGDFQASGSGDLRAVIAGQLNASYPSLQALSDWRRFYAVVSSASIFIDRAGEVLNNDPQYTLLNYKMDVAQVRALRAFAYFCMARIWGDVPLIVTSHDGNFDRKARTPQQQVLAFAETELLSAVNDLPYRYGLSTDVNKPQLYYGSTNTTWDGVLINKISAYAMLAHIAAWDSRYADAAAYANLIMKNYDKAAAGYVTTASLTSPTGFFYNKSTSQFFMLSFDWTNREATVDGHLESLTLAAPLISKPVPDIYVSADTVLRIFSEPLDERFSIDSAGVAVTPYFTGVTGVKPIFSKIKVIRDGSTDGSLAIYSSGIVFSRLEEITLLYAEAMAVLGNRTEAISAMDAVRQKRGLNRYLNGSGDLITDIFLERRRELMGEGWRWFDQVRYQRIKNNNPAFTAMMKQGGIYWPVAQTALDNNNLLVQTPYWR